MVMTSTAVSEGQAADAFGDAHGDQRRHRLSASDSCVHHAGTISRATSRAEKAAVRLPATRPTTIGTSIAFTRRKWV